MALAEFNNLYNIRYGTSPPTLKYVPLFNYVNYNYTSGTTVASTVIWNIPEDGLLIDIPGNYIFGRCLKSETDNPAITITASNVILDMRSRTLHPKSIGINIKNAVNVTIKNGTIKNAQLHAILIEDSIDIHLSSIKVCGLINCDSSLTPAGIMTKSSADVILHKITVCNLKTKGSSLFGVLFTTTVGSEVNCSTFNCLHNCDGVTAAIGHILSDDIEITCVTISNLSSGFTQNIHAEGHTCIGIIPVFSANIAVSNCNISDIQGSCDDAHGISLFLCIDCTVTNCNVCDVSTGKIGSTSAKTTGVEVYADNVVVHKCTAERITAVNPGDRQCTGFSTALSNNVIFSQCSVDSVTVFNNKGETSKKCAGIGLGYGYAPDPRPAFTGAANNILYVNCTAKSCQIGFDTWFHTNSEWRNIKVSHNCKDVLNVNNSKRTYTCNRCSECPGGLSTTLTNVAIDNTVQQPKTIRCECYKG